MSNIILQTKALSRVFEETGERLAILNGIDFTLCAGDFAVLTGASGSGKSTFLNLIGLLDTPTSGEIYFNGKNLSKVSAEEKDDYHRRYIGFVFQFHHLLSEFTSLENVCVPARILGGKSQTEIKERAIYLLETVGLKDRLNHLPRELSGGERQRISIARAILKNPQICGFFIFL